MYPADDTIVAVSSAPQSSAVGIIRLSGPDAFGIAGGVFSPQGPFGLSQDNHRCRIRGRCRLDHTATCDATAYLFSAPQSYTGQHIVELHLPGAKPLLEMVTDSLLAGGARQAEPGEFTARAFLNGRMDLSEAEAVAQVISARSDAHLRAAERLLDGELHRTCSRLVGRISDTLGLIELQIDFSDQQIEVADNDQIQRQIQTARDDLERLLDQSIGWVQLRQLPQVAVAGPVNSGKSSLVNALLGFDRGIVSNIAGATRDLLTAPMPLSHGECMLIDTAGFGGTTDPLAQQAQALARKTVTTCDLLCWVIDISSKDHTAALDLLNRMDTRANIIIVANKLDLPATPDSALAAIRSALSSGNRPVIAVSALRRDNLAELSDGIETALHTDGADYPADAIALTVRQRRQLLAAQRSLDDALSLLRDRRLEAQAELIAVEIRDALDHLGAITGQVLTEDILEGIFSKFCIGK